MAPCRDALEGPAEYLSQVLWQVSQCGPDIRVTVLRTDFFNLEESPEKPEGNVSGWKIFEER